MEIKIQALNFTFLGVLLLFSSLSLEIEARRRNSAYNGWRSPSTHQHGDVSQTGGFDYEQSPDFSNIQDYDNWDKTARNRQYQNIDDDGRQHSVDDPESWEEFSHIYQNRQRESTTRYPTRNRFGGNQRTNLPKPQIQPPQYIASSTTTTPETPIITIGLEEVSSTTEIPQPHDGPETTTDAGTFRGKIVKTPTGKDVVAFLGIPFAKPPVGDLKFKRPVPMDKLKTPYNAMNLPNACFQSHFESFPDNRGEAQFNPNTNISVDCLYLNIWIPASVFEEKENKLATVMFWIYGGAYFSGSSALDIYNGAILASENEVIVVSTQYRLGPLGFLFFGTDDAPGNVGLLDQALALKWTNEHIKHFGGDSNSITLFGESAGGASTSFHSLSPLSRTFFKRSILMSGVSPASWAVNTPNKAREISYKLAKLAGCDTKSSPQSIIACLREVDPKKLDTLQWELTGGQILSFAFTPTVDGYFLHDMPINIVGTRDAKRHEILIGIDKDEGTYFLLYQYLNYLSDKKATNIPFDKYIDMMKEVFQFYSDFEKDLIINYYTNWENPNDGYKNQKIISQAIGDFFFNCPLRRYADIWSNRGLKVFFYQFTQRTSTNPWAEWMGVIHGDEIEYVFGEPLKKPDLFTPEEANLSKHMMKLFSQFAKTGNPSPNWDRYSSEAPIFVELNAKNLSATTSEDRYGPDANNCAFWNEILPSIQNKLSSEQEQNDNQNSNRFNRPSFRSSKPVYRSNRQNKRRIQKNEDSQCSRYHNLDSHGQEGLGYRYYQHQPRRQRTQNCESFCENYSSSSVASTTTTIPFLDPTKLSTPAPPTSD